MGLRRIGLLLLISGSLSFLHAKIQPARINAPDDCKTLLAEDLERGHEPKGFIVDRDLGAYNQVLYVMALTASHELDPAYVNIFMKDLRALTKGSVWLDAGTGDGVAIKNFLQQINSLAHVYGLSFKASEALQKLEKTYPDRVKVFEGIFTDFENAQIGRVDLITDVFGVLGYAKDGDPRPGSGTHAVMQKYLQLLKVGGILHISNPNVVMERKITRGLHSYDQTYFEWLAEQNIPGLEIKINSTGGLRIVKLSENVELPAVEQIEYINDKPPKIRLRPVKQ